MQPFGLMKCTFGDGGVTIHNKTANGRTLLAAGARSRCGSVTLGL